jgi:hypothetical protein
MQLVPVPLKQPSRRHSNSPQPHLPHPLLKWLHLSLWLLLLWCLQPLQRELLAALLGALPSAALALWPL